MSTRSVLARWSRELITWAPQTGVDGYGQRVYGAAVSLPARIDHQSKLVRDAQGEQVVSSTQVYLATDATIGVLDRIILPSGDTPLLLRVDRLQDFTGASWFCQLFFA